MSAVGAGTPVLEHIFTAASVKLLFAAVDEAKHDRTRGHLPRGVEINEATPFALFRCLPAQNSNSDPIYQRSDGSRKLMYDTEITVPDKAVGETVKVLYHLHNPVHKDDLTLAADGKELSVTFDVLRQIWISLPDPAAMGYVCVLDMNPVVQANNLDSRLPEYDGVCSASLASVFHLGVSVVVAFGAKVCDRWRDLDESLTVGGVTIVDVEDLDEDPLLLFTYVLASDRTAAERKLLVMLTDHPSASTTCAGDTITQLHEHLLDTTLSLELLASKFRNTYDDKWYAPSCLTQSRADLFSVPYWCDLPYGETRIDSGMSYAMLYRLNARVDGYGRPVPFCPPITGTNLKLVAGSRARGACFNVLYHVHNAENKDNMALNSAGSNSSVTYKAISAAWKASDEVGQVCVHNMVPVAAEALDSSGSEYGTVCRASITCVFHLGVSVVVAFGKEVCDRWALVERTPEIDNVVFTHVSRARTLDKRLLYLTFKFHSRACGVKELVVFLVSHETSFMREISYSNAIFSELTAINLRLSQYHTVNRLTVM